MQADNKYENIFDKGCLVQLSVSIWGGVKKIDERKAKEALGSEWAKARKSLVDPEALKEIGKVRNAARNYLRGMSLPFPIHGVSFVGFGAISKIDEKLKEFEEGFKGESEKFFGEYEEAIKKAREMLGDLFDLTDYPGDIRPFFDFEWRFITLQSPGQNSLIDPELVEREKKKFIDTMERAREMGVLALREEFRGILKSCVERLSDGVEGKKKIFRDSMIGNFFDFFETFKSRNIFQDESLKVLCEQAEGILRGVDVESLREDDGLRKVVKMSMEGIEGVLEKAIEEMPGRKLRLSEDEG